MMDRWVDGWVDGWMDGWINGWMGWVDRWIYGKYQHCRTGKEIHHLVSEFLPGCPYQLTVYALLDVFRGQ